MVTRTGKSSRKRRTHEEGSLAAECVQSYCRSFFWPKDERLTLHYLIFLAFHQLYVIRAGGHKGVLHKDTKDTLFQGTKGNHNGRLVLFSVLS
jgi:hypothetical protein